MTLVLSGRLVQASPYSVCTIKSDLLQLVHIANSTLSCSIPDYSPSNYCQHHDAPDYQAHGVGQMMNARKLMPECFNQAVLAI
jgi:hypothetical protein